MIIGIGNDICDIRRIEKTLAKYGTRFQERIFTHVEQQTSQSRVEKGASYAKRFAAKEACAKALGTGMRFGVSWKDIGVMNAANGNPTLFLQGGARKRLDAMTPKGHRAMLHLSISDEYPLAQAFVIIEALPV